MKDGGQAFPLPPNSAYEGHNPGMTMRQWYKGLALQGILACPESHGTIAVFVKEAAQYADAMLAEDAQHEKEA